MIRQIKKENAMSELTGRYQGSRRGFGFIIPAEGGEDYFVPPGDSSGAWDGDTVTYRQEGSDGRDGRRSGKILSVVTHANKIVTGRLCKDGRIVYLAPDSDRLPTAIQMTGKLTSAHIGDKVAVEVLSFGTRKTPPLGALRENFGRCGSRVASTAAILYNYEIDRAFPQTVLDAADAVPQSVQPAALKNRTDLREKLIVTIDGASAKDLDDAVSLETDEKGRLVLGVHIADVSHYVNHRGEIDKEAFDRGTSVYFADQVIPMLPVALSNGICSLNPNVDRLTLSCLMTVDKNGNVVDHTICKSVICSKARLTYEGCNALLAGEENDLTPETAELIRRLATLAKTLTKKRRNRGALMLETAESYFICDENGVPIDVKQRQSGIAESLIEECMLLANETVAEHLCVNKLPGVFRIHEKPSMEKAAALQEALEPLGYDVHEPDGHALQAVLDAAKGKPEASAVNMLILRSLMKARYQAENAGHFGLAADFYCHFTSPIRRYPDLIVHRILSAVLEPGTNEEQAGNRLAKLAAFAERAALQSSEREVAAQNAEREIEKLYMAEFMQDKLGQEFAGAVSGVTKFGIFVLLDNGVEGMLPLNRDEDASAYVMGAPMRVICEAADQGTGEITFSLPGEPPRMPRSSEVKKILPKGPQQHKPAYRKKGHPQKASTRSKQRR
ncbi:MAG: ribonuclease R [Oscillospiraceae bacterium]